MTGVSPGVIHTAEILHKQVDQIAARLRNDLCENIPELKAHHEVWTHLELSIYANMSGFFGALTRGLDSGEVEPPPNALYLPRYLAHVVEAPDLMLRIYYSGHSLIWMNWTMPAVFEAAAATGEGPEELLNYIYSQQYEYLSRVGIRVSQEFLQEQENLQHNNRNDARRIVTQIMMGHPVPDSALQPVRYGFKDSQRALVCWVSPSDSVDQLELEELARDLSSELTLAPSLVIQGRPNEVWVWVRDRTKGRIPKTKRLNLEKRLASRQFVAHVAIGESGEGLEGFRASHKDALRTQAIVVANPPQNPSVTEYDDVALISLLLSDRDAAKSFVKHELQDLSSHTIENRILRDTTLAFLQYRGSYTRAAAALSVHRNTIWYRIQKAEVAIGRAIDNAGTELQSALLLAKWFDSYD